jgi:hypothetical protein
VPVETVKPKTEEFTMPTTKYESMMETEPIFEENQTTTEKPKTKPPPIPQTEPSKKTTMEHADLQAVEPILEKENQQMEKMEA